MNKPYFFSLSVENLIPSFHKSIPINNSNQALVVIYNSGYILFNK